MRLFEKFRPAAFGQVIGQNRVVRSLKLQQERGTLAPGAYWLSGPSGSGKTTTARLIAQSVAPDWCIEEVDAQDLTKSAMRSIEQAQRYRPIGGGHHVVIVNEAHGLSSKIVSHLQTVVEDRTLAPNSVWVFTTTNKGQQRLFDTRFDALPFFSRCVHHDFQRIGDEIAARHVQGIARKEGLDGRPQADYVRLASVHDANLRSMLNAVEAGVMLFDDEPIEGMRLASTDPVDAERKKKWSAAGRKAAETKRRNLARKAG